MTVTIKRESGQSVIEFVIVSLTFFTFFFIIVRMSLNFVQGHYVHYATFMAARAYFAGNTTERAQLDAANQVLAEYLGEDGTRYGLRPNTDEGGSGTVPGSLVGPGPDFNASDINWRWQQGVTFSFKQRLYVLPLINVVSSRGRRGEVSFTSESWLGREIDSRTCSDYLSRRRWLFDNGC